MKKKSIIILSTIAFLVVVGIIVTIVCVSSSNSIAKKMKKATESVKNVTKVTTVCEVTKENINAVLGTEDFEILDNAKIVFVFENKNLVSIECVFKTTSSKDVTIYTTYTY